MEALGRFRCYLEVVSFQVFTDNQVVRNRRWGLVATDFIIGLPETESKFNAIMTWSIGCPDEFISLPQNPRTQMLTRRKYTLKKYFHSTGSPTPLFRIGTPDLCLIWTELMEIGGVQLNMSSSRHPQTDGSSEISNRMVESNLCCYCAYRQNDWDVLLPSAEFSYNSSFSESLGAAPFEIDLRRNPKSTLDMLASQGSNTVESVSSFQMRLKGALYYAQFAHRLGKAKQTADSFVRLKKPTYNKGDMV